MIFPWCENSNHEKYVRFQIFFFWKNRFFFQTGRTCSAFFAAVKQFGPAAVVSNSNYLPMSPHLAMAPLGLVWLHWLGSPSNGDKTILTKGTVGPSPRA